MNITQMVVIEHYNAFSSYLIFMLQHNNINIIMILNEIEYIVQNRQQALVERETKVMIIAFNKIKCYCLL